MDKWRWFQILPLLREKNRGEKVIYRKRKEIDLQRDVVQWIYAQYPKTLMTIAPNIRKTLIQGVMLKRMGLRPGTPDLMIFEPRGSYHGLFVELKMPGNYPSDEQKSFKAELEARFYASAICPGNFKTERQCFDWAIGTIKNYMELSTSPKGE
jgi:hypothetical protein